MSQVITENIIMEALNQVYDPEIRVVNIVDLGLIYSVDVHDTAVRVTMTLTTKGCPMSSQIARMVKEAVEGVPGVTASTIQIVWDPVWSPDMMSDTAKKRLGFS